MMSETSTSLGMTFSELWNAYTKLQTERDLLRNYADHTYFCATKIDPKNKCDCGFDDVIHGIKNKSNIKTESEYKDRLTALDEEERYERLLRRYRKNWLKPFKYFISCRGGWN